MEGMIKIGQLASAAGVTCDTVRYYEQLRLLPRANRTRTGYRLYFNTDVERLHFMKQAQALRHSLDQMSELLSPRGAGLAECQRGRDVLSTELKELDTQLAEMRAFRRILAAYLAECEATLARKRGDCCPVLFEISHPIRCRLRCAVLPRHQKFLREKSDED